MYNYIYIYYIPYIYIHTICVYIYTHYVYIYILYIYIVNTISHIASSINRMASPSKTPGLRDGQVLGGCQDLGGSQMARDLRDDDLDSVYMIYLLLYMIYHY